MKKLGQLRLHRAGARLGGVQPELHLLRRHDGLRPVAGCEPPRHRAEVPPGAHHEGGLDLAVHHPAAAPALQAPERGLEPEAGAGALQQVVVELAAADAVAHRLAEARPRLPVPDAPHGEALQGLADPLLRVDPRVHPERTEDGRGHPAGAGLVAGEGAPVQDQDVQTRLAQPRSRRGARRTAPDDQDVSALHWPPPSSRSRPPRPCRGRRGCGGSCRSGCA